MYSVILNSTMKEGIHLSNWYTEKTSQVVYPPFGVIGFMDNQTLDIKGVMVFTNYNGFNIEAHMYMPNCLNRKAIKDILNYIFNTLKCTRLTAIVPRSNKKLLKVMPKLKFVFETVLIRWYGPFKKDDGIVYRMTSKEASNWIQVNGY